VQFIQLVKIKKSITGSAVYASTGAGDANHSVHFRDKRPFWNMK